MVGPGPEPKCIISYIYNTEPILNTLTTESKALPNGEHIQVQAALKRQGLCSMTGIQWCKKLYIISPFKELKCHAEGVRR